MVFNGSVFVLVVVCILVLWALGISIVVLRLRKHYNNVTKGVTKAGLKEILDALLEEQKKDGTRIEVLEHKLESLQKDGRFHIQRIAVVRFNPFDDTGGSQSFTMAILNDHDTGVVITSLHARSGNRWYVKEILNGKGVGVELSREEQSVIKKAGKKKYEK